MSRINVKKLYSEKKQAKWAKKPAAGEIFFTFTLQFSVFSDGYKLV